MSQKFAPAWELLAISVRVGAVGVVVTQIASDLRPLEGH